MPDEFGGIEVGESTPSDEFGGIPLDQSPPATQSQQPVSEDDQLSQDYLAQRNKPVLQKAIDTVKAPFESIGNMAGNAVQGFQTAGQELGSGSWGVKDLPAIALQAAKGAGIDILNMGQDQAQQVVDTIKRDPKQLLSLISSPTSFFATNKLMDVAKPALGIPASQGEIQDAVARAQSSKALNNEKQIELNKSPSPELSGALPDAVNLGLMASGGLAGMLEKPKAVGTTSSILAAPVQFERPINGKVVGSISDAITPEIKTYLDRSLSTDSDVHAGFAEAVRNNPTGTTDLAGLAKSADDAIEKLKTEVKMVKGGVSDPVPVNNVADALENLKTKNMDENQIDFLNQQIAKYKGQAWSIDDLHKSIQHLGNEVFWGRIDKPGFENKALATARGALNNSFSDAMTQVGGPRAARLQKTMSNLIKLNDAIEARTEKLAKHIPPDLRGSMSGLQATLAGIKGLTDFAAHPVAGTMELTHSVMKAMDADKKLFMTNPEKMLNKANSKLRQRVNFTHDNTPIIQPKSPSYAGPTPPRLEDLRNEQIARSIGGQEDRPTIGEIPLSAETLTQMGPKAPSIPNSQSISNLSNVPGQDVGRSVIPYEGMSLRQQQGASAMVNSMAQNDIRPPAVPDTASFSSYGKAVRDVPRAPEQSFGKEFTSQPDFMVELRKLERQKEAAKTAAKKAEVEAEKKKLIKAIADSSSGDFFLP